LKNYKGKFESDFPVTVSGELSGDNIKGKINDGGISISCHNHKGLIQLAKM